jgi:hypothetical protein
MKQEFYVANRDFRRDSDETKISVTAEHLAVPPIEALKNIYQSRFNDI